MSFLVPSPETLLHALEQWCRAPNPQGPQGTRSCPPTSGLLQPTSVDLCAFRPSIACSCPTRRSPASESAAGRPLSWLPRSGLFATVSGPFLVQFTLLHLLDETSIDSPPHVHPPGSSCPLLSLLSRNDTDDQEALLFTQIGPKILRYKRHQSCHSSPRPTCRSCISSFRTSSPPRRNKTRYHKLMAQRKAARSGHDHKLWASRHWLLLLPPDDGEAIIAVPRIRVRVGWTTRIPPGIPFAVPTLVRMRVRFHAVLVGYVAWLSLWSSRQCLVPFSNLPMSTFATSRLAIYHMATQGIDGYAPRRSLLPHYSVLT